MQKEAIEQIQQTAIQATQPEVFKAIAVPLVALPEKMTIHSLEKHMPGRARFRGSMVTNSIHDFVRYTKGRLPTGGIQCFIDTERMAAKTFFNLGDIEQPGHADDVAILSLDKTAEFRALLSANGATMTQKAMAEWLEDWRVNLMAVVDDESDMDIKTAIAAIRRAVIDMKRTDDHSVDNFGARRSAMESIEARGRDGALPAGFWFRCVPYTGLRSRSFYLRLSLLTGGDAPRFIMRVVKLEQETEAMAQEFSEMIAGYFDGDAVTSYVGTFDA